MLSLGVTCRWLSISAFELSLHLAGILFTTILVALRTDLQLYNAITVWVIVSPCLLACALHTFFLLIVVVRRGAIRPSLIDVSVPAALVVLTTAFYVSLASRRATPDFGVVFVPIWLAAILLLVRCCSRPSPLLMERAQG